MFTGLFINPMAGTNSYLYLATTFCSCTKTPTSAQNSMLPPLKKGLLEQAGGGIFLAITPKYPLYLYGFYATRTPSGRTKSYQRLRLATKG